MKLEISSTLFSSSTKIPISSSGNSHIVSGIECLISMESNMAYASFWVCSFSLFSSCACMLIIYFASIYSSCLFANSSYFLIASSYFFFSFTCLCLSSSQILFSSSSFFLFSSSFFLLFSFLDSCSYFRFFYLSYLVVSFSLSLF